MAESNGLMRNLFLTGAVVKDKISVWSAQKKLKPADLGIPEDEVNAELVSLGSKYIIPKDEIAELYKIRSRVKSYLNNVSLSFSFGGNFVSNEKMDELRERMDRFKQEFNEKVEDIGNRYPEMVDEMKQKWHEEATTIASRRGDETLVFMVMNRVEQAFPTWNEIRHKFKFGYREYRDINDVARQFIEDSTKDILEKLKGFANSIKDRLENSNLQERNLRPIREYIEAMREGVMVFENDKLNGVMEDLNTWVQEGTAKGVMEEEDFISKAMSEAMDKVIDVADNQVEEICKASVESMTRLKRRIEV